MMIMRGFQYPHVLLNEYIRAFTKGFEPSDAEYLVRREYSTFSDRHKALRPELPSASFEDFICEHRGKVQDFVSPLPFSQLETCVSRLALSILDSNNYSSSQPPCIYTPPCKRLSTVAIFGLA